MTEGAGQARAPNGNRPKRERERERERERDTQREIQRERQRERERERERKRKILLGMIHSAVVVAPVCVCIGEVCCMLLFIVAGPSTKGMSVIVVAGT